MHLFASVGAEELLKSSKSAAIAHVAARAAAHQAASEALAAHAPA